MTIEYIILSFGFIVSVIYLYFLCWFWWGIKKVRGKPLIEIEEVDVPFSILIAAHNEEKSIAFTLDSLEEQYYPREKFEIVVVADRCSDDTVKIVKKYQSQFPMLQLIEVNNVPEEFSPKKYAIHTAVGKAQFDNLILLDADCQLTPSALKCFSKFFQHGFEVVVSIPKFKRFSTLLYNYYLPERVLTWGIAAASVGHEKPFLAFGPVWAYTREAYHKAGGMTKISHTLSGDDDLLIYQMGKNSLPVSFCFNPEGWGETRSPHTILEFVRQRRRHHSAGKYYAREIQFGYFLFHISNFALWFLPLFESILVLPLLIKIILDFTILSKTARIFHENLNMLQGLFFEIGFVIHHLVIVPLGFIGKVRWR